ncbi:MAG: hypothetical protein HYU76_13570 [Betaproteobacteria bacterium]|nr:hypothetical protein [Betaproteobacteria bacterium]
MENVRNVEANTAAAQECCAPAAKSGWLNPRNLLIGVVVLGGGALVLGWDWLVAAGLATFVIMALSCGAMCYFGMCANRKQDAGTGAQAIPPKEAQPPAIETVANAEPRAIEKAKSA